MKTEMNHEHNWEVYKTKETSFEFVLKMKCTNCGKKKKEFILKDDYETS